MTNFQALFLALIQGLTEFLPISSSGHLILFQKIFRLSQPPVFFDILLHLGTLGSIFLFFRREIVNWLINWKRNLNFFYLLFLGSLPAAIFGFLLNSHLKTIFNSLFWLGTGWLLFGLGLIGSQNYNLGKKKTKDKISKIDALVVGFFQALALFPGISRSGSTILAGLGRGFPPKKAFEFSFFLAVPAILGATVFELKEASLVEVSLPVSVLSLLLAAVSGYGALSFLRKIVCWEKFYLFGYYCLVMGILTLILAFLL